MDLTDIFRTCHPNAEEYTSFSSAHETFSRMDHILGNKSNLINLRKIEIISNTFSDHNTMKLNINYKGKKSCKTTNTWKLSNTFLNNQQVTEEIKREIKKFLETNDNENTTIQNTSDAAKAVLRGRFIAIQSYLKKQTNNNNKKTLNRQSNFTPKTTGKRRKTTTTTKLVEGYIFLFKFCFLFYFC